MIVFCDGASNPKTKKSGIGAVWFEETQFKDPTDGKTLIHNPTQYMSLSKEIFGSKTKYIYPTNNEAEYLSLIAAIEKSIENDILEIVVYMDSKLVVNQVNGLWKINFPHLQELKNKVDKLKTNLKLTVKHIRREYNTHADIESKNCIFVPKEKQKQINEFFS